MPKETLTLEPAQRMMNRKPEIEGLGRDCLSIFETIPTESVFSAGLM
jgi:hypothetical protein